MKTFVGNLFAASALTAFIATSVPSVSALAVSPAPHVARHLGVAHAVKRNINKKRCRQKIAPGTDTPSGGSPTNNGGSSGGSSNNGGSGLGGKKGLAFPMGCNDLDKWHPNTNVHWHYNWRGIPYGDCPSGLPPFIPMLWGWDYLQSFIDATSNGQTPPIVLFLNEPDLSSYLSSGISPQTAAQMWNQYIEPVRARGARAGSAAVTSNPASMQWQKDFESACNCKPDFDTVHFYGTKVQDFINYVTNWHSTFGRQIWVTEVACQDFNGGPQCDMGQIYDFVGQIAHWCETTSFIDAYTFFGAMSDVQNVNQLDKMMGGDNGPNDLGNYMLTAY